LVRVINRLFLFIKDNETNDNYNRLLVFNVTRSLVGLSKKRVADGNDSEPDRAHRDVLELWEEEQTKFGLNKDDLWEPKLTGLGFGNTSVSTASYDSASSQERGRGGAGTFKAVKRESSSGARRSPKGNEKPPLNQASAKYFTGHKLKNEVEEEVKSS
jgi:hypothetical protein